MRLGHTSTLSLLSVGLVWTLGWGCGSKDSGSTFSGTSSGSTGTGVGSTGAAGSIGTGPITTGGIMTTGTGSTGAGGSGTVDPDAACGSSKEGINQIPVDVFIMLDKSGSMTCPASDDACMNGMGTPSRWDAVSQAIIGFVNAPAPTMAGVGVGIGFFGLGGGNGNNNADCNIPGYATPVVPIAPLPGSAMPVANAIMRNMPGGGTPTTPALTGAIQYARAYTMQQAGMRTAAVLLVTDGNPNGCNSTVQNGTAAAQAGFMGTPQIKTYVVGLGTVATLDAIALAGSGGLTHYIPASGDVAGALSAALTQITGMITCTYTIPMVAGKPVDPSKVNVQITIGGMSQTVGKVANMAACGQLGGWYYDSDTAPTQIILCPQTCDAVKADMNAGVSVLYGCPSKPPQ